MFTSHINRLQRREAGEKGFTLLELIAVVVVIAILAAIAIGMFSNQERAAHASALAQDVANSRASVLDATQGTGPFEGAPTVASEGNTVVAASHPDVPGAHMIYGWNEESDSEICYDSTTGQTNADACGSGANPAKNAPADGGSGGGGGGNVPEICNNFRDGFDGYSWTTVYNFGFLRGSGAITVTFIDGRVPAECADEFNRGRTAGAASGSNADDLRDPCRGSWYSEEDEGDYIYHSAWQHGRWVAQGFPIPAPTNPDCMAEFQAAVDHFS